MTVFHRFWTSAAVAPHGDGWAVTLDGKTALTPGRAALATRHKRLAEAVSAEWADAPEKVDPLAMPMTGYLNAVIDRVTPHRPGLAADVTTFAASELICYRAEAPEVLVERQKFGWDPILAWLDQRHGARLICGVGVTPILQSEPALARLALAVTELDTYRLAAALKLTGIMKSLALTLAVIDGERDTQVAYELSRIDEDFQSERWGEDAEAARRVAREREEMSAVAAFLCALD